MTPTAYFYKLQNKNFPAQTCTIMIQTPIFEAVHNPIIAQL